MHMWCHLPTSFKRRHVLQLVALVTMIVVFITMTIFARVAFASPSTNKTINFQARLLSASGAVVPDGHYNIQFKIYQGGSGAAVGNPDGSLKWTETYVNGGDPTGGVQVKNGYLSVNLGSVNPFGSSVDWNQDTLWLSMNVAGKDAACTTFGSDPCAADGEMLPMKRITATPFSLNSGAVGGKTADDLVQLSQGVQIDTTDTSSIFINKTGSGNLIQLQNTATDVFTVGNSGDLTFGNNADKTISVDGATPDTAGKSLSVIAGAGGSGLGSSGGDMIIQAGTAGGTNGDGGDVVIDAGDSTGTGSDGAIAIGSNNASSITIGSTSTATDQDITIGAANTAGGSSDVTIGSGGSADSGTTTIQSKDTVTIKTDGTTRMTFTNDGTARFGNGESSGAPSDATIQGTDSTADGVDGGSLMIRGGDVTVGNADGGDIVISGGSGSGTGVNGSVIINTPTFSTATSDPNCYTDGAVVASSCTIASSSVNNSAAVIVGFSAAGQTASLPDPATTTAGRVLYVMAAGTSQDFTLSINGGGVDNEIPMQPNTTAIMMWNGSAWTSTNVSDTSALEYADNGTRIQVGDGLANGEPTLITVDRAASAPTGSGDALLGSMYYDTTLGKLQCYEADGWGGCSDSPDTFVTISPEYTNAVMNGADIGTITSDFCSDTLNINDGSSGQPTICGANETYNFYNWTTAEASAQTRSIFVTYQLPTNFKQFVPGSTSLMGRTDNTSANVSYQLYRDAGSAGLVACGSTVSVSSGAQSSWQEAVATGAADPASCGFQAGDSLFIRINLTAANNTNAYVSNLNFTYSNQ